MYRNRVSFLFCYSVFLLFCVLNKKITKMQIIRKHPTRMEVLLGYLSCFYNFCCCCCTSLCYKIVFTKEEKTLLANWQSCNFVYRFFWYIYIYFFFFLWFLIFFFLVLLICFFVFFSIAVIVVVTVIVIWCVFLSYLPYWLLFVDFIFAFTVGFCCGLVLPAIVDVVVINRCCFCLCLCVRCVVSLLIIL